MRFLLLALFCLIFIAGCSSPRVVYQVKNSLTGQWETERVFISKKEADKYVQTYAAYHDYLIVPIRVE